MSTQLPPGFSPPVEKQLSQYHRGQIAVLLGKKADDLTEFFRALEEIITSAARVPSIDPAALKTARQEVKKMGRHAHVLAKDLATISAPIKMRIFLGSSIDRGGSENADGGKNHLGGKIGDFSIKLAQFQHLLRDINEALAPPKGAGLQADHLRNISYYCAIQYKRVVGTAPAKRTDGVFRKMMDVVLSAIDLQLPKDPYNILSPAINRMSGPSAAAPEPAPDPAATSVPSVMAPNPNVLAVSDTPLRKKRAKKAS